MKRFKVVGLAIVAALFAAGSAPAAVSPPPSPSPCKQAVFEVELCAKGISPTPARCDYWRMIATSCQIHVTEGGDVLGLIGQALPRGSGYSAAARGLNWARIVFNGVDAKEERLKIDWSAAPTAAEFTDKWFEQMGATFGACIFKLCPATDKEPEKIFKRFAANVPQNERTWEVERALKAKCLAGLFGVDRAVGTCESTVFQVLSAQATDDSWVWNSVPNGTEEAPPACLPCPDCPTCLPCPAAPIVEPGLTAAQRTELRRVCSWPATPKLKARCVKIVETAIKSDAGRVH